MKSQQNRVELVTRPVPTPAAAIPVSSAATASVPKPRPTATSAVQQQQQHLLDAAGRQKEAWATTQGSLHPQTAETGQAR